jgi:ribonucleoside-triphosphate reductase (formate)
VRVIECEVYTRVVGYYRPVQQFNPGKKAEFQQRKPLKNPQSNQGDRPQST